ncbi:MAG: Asp-tRNA(Asn)/Glu-tRNA(Gln) amidotransferase subunit GatA [Parcubacteria group bacterium]
MSAAKLPIKAAQLARLSLTDTVVGLAAKKFSSLELVEAYLKRRDQVEPKIEAYLLTLDDQARAQAKQVDERRAHADKLPALAGVPIAVKDNFNLIGSETTCGSKILKKYIAPYDATAVARLKEAGVIILGKTNLDEFAMGASTENSAFKTTKNPWDTTRVPGGSSGGSAAAVASDMVAAALGSDTGGSVRQPAALTNIVGLKPSYGRISRYGLVALASSIDVVGTLTKTVADAAVLLERLAGEDSKDATCYPEPAPQYPQLIEGPNIKGLKVGLPKEYFAKGLDPAVKEQVFTAAKQLEQLGAKLVDVSLPHSKYALPTYYIILPCEASANLARYDGIKYGESIMRSKEVSPRDLLEVYMRSRAQGFGAEPTRRIMLGTYALSSGYYDAYYRRAQKVRTLVRRDFLEVFKKVQVLLTPTTPTTAFKIGEKKQDPIAMYLCDVMTVAVNVAGVPALSLPCGFVGELPVGMQLIGPDYNEELILKVGHAYQLATDWHRRRPAL